MYVGMAPTLLYMSCGAESVRWRVQVGGTIEEDSHMMEVGYTIGLDHPSIHPKWAPVLPFSTGQ